MTVTHSEKFKNFIWKLSLNEKNNKLCFDTWIFLNECLLVIVWSIITITFMSLKLMILVCYNLTTTVEIDKLQFMTLPNNLNTIKY